MYFYRGCSKHITEDKSKFSYLTLMSKGFVTYGDKNKGKILGTGKVGVTPFFTIDDVLYIWMV